MAASMQAAGGAHPSSSSWRSFQPLDRLPAARRGRGLGGGDHLARAQAVQEVGFGRVAIGNGAQEVAHGDDEAVAEAERHAGDRPEQLGARVRRADRDRPKSALGRRIAGLVQTHFGRLLGGELDRALGAVHGEADVHLVAAGEPAGLERAGRAVFELDQHVGDLVDVDRCRLAGAVEERAAGKVGARGGAHAPDLARQIARHVDDVAADVGAAAAARDRLVQPPADRHGRIETVVVEEMAAIVDDLADAAGLDDLPGEGHGRPFAIHEADLVHASAACGGPVHRARALERVGQRLLAQHVLAAGEGVDADLGVAVVRGQHEHQVDVVGAGHRPPVVGGLVPAPGPGGALAEPARHLGDAHAPDLGRGRPREAIDRAERERIGPAHEAAAHHTDADRRQCCFPMRSKDIRSIKPSAPVARVAPGPHGGALDRGGDFAWKGAGDLPHVWRRA